MPSYSDEKIKAIERFLKAKEVYALECSLCQRFRLSISPDESQRTGLQNEKYKEHRKRLREAERVYREEQFIFNNSLLDPANISTPEDKAEQEATKRYLEEYSKMLLGITPTAAQAAREQLKAEKEHEKERKKLEKRVNPRKENIYSLEDTQRVLKGLRLTEQERAALEIPTDKSDIDDENERFLSEDLKGPLEPWEDPEVLKPHDSGTPLVWAPESKTESENQEGEGEQK